MGNQAPLLEKTVALVSETMGNDTGKQFHEFYKTEDDDEVITGARALLMDFIGPKMTEEKLKTLSGKP